GEWRRTNRRQQGSSLAAKRRARGGKKGEGIGEDEVKQVLRMIALAGGGGAAWGTPEDPLREILLTVNFLGLQASVGEAPDAGPGPADLAVGHQNSASSHKDDDSDTASLVEYSETHSSNWELSLVWRELVD
ncbi:unnamed protein product, partial [Chrysoparadoxa australica]